MRRLVPDAISIFILPPSIEELHRRLQGRGSDSEEVVARRMAAAREDIAQCLAFDYLVVNDRFADALEDLVAIARARRSSIQTQEDRLAGLLLALSH